MSYFFRIFVSALLCPLLVNSAQAWSKAYHEEITIDGYDNSGTFKSYITTYGLTTLLRDTVQDADSTSEKYYVAHLDDIYYPSAGIDIVEASGDPDRVQHVTSILSYHLPDDQRLRNAIECLDLALQIKAGSPTTAEREESMRIFANGLHLLQDYFAHYDAPGKGSTGVSHGVTNLVDTNNDGTPDTPAGELVDDLHWDCHSDSGNGLVPYSLREIDLFRSPYWHYHASKTSSWRYQAAYHSTIEYMQAYAVYESASTFESVLARGYVVNFGVTTYVDLLTRIVVDNTDAECTFGGSWSNSTSVSGYYFTDYAHDGTSGADSTSIWAKWTPVIPITDDYKIYMRWAASPNKASAAPLTIDYNGGIDTSKTVDQTADGNQWNYIGTYSLSAGTGNSVKIHATTAGYTEADAVMFIRDTYP